MPTDKYGRRMRQDFYDYVVESEKKEGIYGTPKSMICESKGLSVEQVKEGLAKKFGVPMSSIRIELI